MDGPWMTPPPEPRTWWQRNWKWVVPVGIVDLLFSLSLLFGAIYLLVSGVIRESEAYTGALARARSSPDVVRELGEPMEPGWWLSGSIRVNGPSGTADFATSLRGPSGRGTLHASAEKQAGRWRYTLLEVAVADGGDRIDLLTGRTPEDLLHGE